MNLILFGAPGAGKGTQASFIAKKFNLFQLSTGDILRNEIYNKSEIGKKIEQIINQGDFVTDNIIDDLLKKIITKPSYRNRIIFDGYPRNLEQANNLNKIFEKKKLLIGSIIYLKVSREIIEQRILNRIICEKCNKIFNELINYEEIKSHECGEKYLKKRHDDDKDLILKRFDTYKKDTKPVLDFYANQKNFFEIDASAKIDEITRKIEQIIKV